MATLLVMDQLILSLIWIERATRPVIDFISSFEIVLFLIARFAHARSIGAKSSEYVHLGLD